MRHGSPPLKAIEDAIEKIQRSVMPDTSTDKFLLACCWSLRRYRRKPIVSRPGVMENLNNAANVCPDPRVQKEILQLISRLGTTKTNDPRWKK